jgi:DNA-binding transcriptional MerR regulator
MPDLLTIGQVARRSGLSRSTLLYYDRLGLLEPADRSKGNYRLYSRSQAERLQKIRLYRRMGMPLKKIRLLLDQVVPDSPRAARVLQDHLQTLEREIERLQEQQRQIVRLLESMHRRNALPGIARKVRARSRRRVIQSINKEAEVVNKDQFVKILKAAGLSEEDMENIHRQFEKMEPEAHQEFLHSLGLGAEEIEKIREKSRA